MKSLFDGVKHFNQQDFEHYRELFSRIGRTQDPHTLFIGCSDSRVVPNLITRTLPGDLFVIRNVANIVPPYRATEEYLATTSAIEYAVEALHVDNIVVCGHSNCGGCNALYKSDAELARLPHTRRWLDLARPAKARVALERIVDEREREWRTELENVVEQLGHLMTYPYIDERFRAGTVHIYGWYYVIESGEVFNYDLDSQTFGKIE